jgi:hypothetical protein
MSYNSCELRALVAPIWGIGMEDLEGVTIAGMTKDGRVVYADSAVGNQGPGGPGIPTESATPEQDMRIARHLIGVAYSILAKTTGQVEP